MRFVQKIGNQIWVHYQGKIFSLPASLKTNTHTQQQDAAEELVAPFSCKVLKIHAKAGAKVKKGDPIIMVEAMKMEYSYASPRDGEIKEILVKEGMIVPQGNNFVSWK